jgi:biopolymer transport protein TolQ
MGNPETDLGGRLASLDMLELVFGASLIVQAVLLLLVLFSVFSWAVILYKARELRRAEQDSEAFLEVYHDRMARGTGGAVTLDENSLSALSSRAQWAGSREAKRLERGLTFLATTGSAAPFIGLFGTVIGIIDAFQGIGRAGSASLAVVAPGIAEALIATAVGLFAAIPATIYYNIYIGKLRGVVSSIDLFGTEFEAALRRFAAPGQTPRPLRAQGE